MHGTPHDSSEATSTDALRLRSSATTARDSAAAERAVAAFIESRINFERLPTERYGLRDFKLDRMRMLLNRLGDPQRQPAVHIAGTKGKGSTAAMIAAILQASGRRVGLFTSPHVTHFGERMTVNGERPASQQLLKLLDELQPVVECMDAIDETMRPTFFEVLTAMAWLHFRDSEVSMVALETGLGGRLDATNVCEPLVSLITSISRDHERLLGSTLGEIAREKAGIIKPGVPVFSGVTEGEPRTVIRTIAEQVGAPFYELASEIRYEVVEGASDSNVERSEPQRVTVDIQTPWRAHRRLRVPLAGEHQAANLALAISAVDCLQSGGWDVSQDEVIDGVSHVCWPLRIEVIRHDPLTIVDAAHNVASVAALVASLRPVAATERVLVFGTARDKDTAGMLRQLAGAFDRVVLTRFVNNPRAVSRNQLEQLATEQLSIPWVWSENPAAACDLVMRNIDPRGLVCSTGSFFLAAEFRAAVLANTAEG